MAYKNCIWGNFCCNTLNQLDITVRRRKAACCGVSEVRLSDFRPGSAIGDAFAPHQSRLALTPCVIKLQDLPLTQFSISNCNYGRRTFHNKDGRLPQEEVRSVEKHACSSDVVCSLNRRCAWCHGLCWPALHPPAGAPPTLCASRRRCL